MKRLIIKIKHLLVIFFILSSCVVKAQTVQRIFTFEKGDEFKKQSFLNSTFIIQRGSQQLDISSSSAVDKTYKITDVNDDTYKFVITIPKMDVEINSIGQKLVYDSEKQIDTTSKIANALKYIVGKTCTVLVDRKGEILSDNDSFAKLANDTLLSFAGIQAESFNKGSQFALIPQFVLANKTLRRGYTWTDTSSYKDQKLKTKFWVDTLTAENTVVKFKSSITGNSINSNTTGTYVLDNKSGVLIQTLVQSISTGYMVYNNAVYAITRRISLSESCIKKGLKTTYITPDLSIPPVFANKSVPKPNN